jgi:hypothetical protein
VDGNRDAEAVYKDVLEWVKAYKDEWKIDCQPEIY